MILLGIVVRDPEKAGHSHNRAPHLLEPRAVTAALVRRR